MGFREGIATEMLQCPQDVCDQLYLGKSETQTQINVLLFFLTEQLAF